MTKQDAETGYSSVAKQHSKTDLNVNYGSCIEAGFQEKNVKTVETDNYTPKFRKVGTSKTIGKVELILSSK